MPPGRAVFLIFTNLLLLGKCHCVHLGEVATVLLIRCLGQGLVAPQGGGQVTVGFGNGIESGISKVSKYGSLASTWSVAFFQASRTEQFLGYWS